MHILVDYENVGNGGLAGSEYLDCEDHVIIFYSNSCKNMQRGYMDDLIQKAGDFEIVKLRQKRKNGLDFYIAVKVGEILKTKPQSKILIVSKDLGYMAVFDYCELYSECRGKIRVKDSIESGIASFGGVSDRNKEIYYRRQNTVIEAEYERYIKRKAIREKLAATEYESEVEVILSIMESGQTPREMYLQTLHRYGIKRGPNMYRVIKGLKQ